MIRTSQRQVPQNQNRAVKILTNIVLLLVTVYGLTTAVLIGLWLILGETNIAINLFVNTLPVGLFPAPFLLIFVIFTRRWRFSIMLLASFAMLIGLYGTILRPLGTSPLPRGEPVTLMTYNTLFSNDDMASVERIIREQNADVVALQEVTQEHLNYIDTNLQDLYPYVARPNRVLSTHGQIILSKFPISTANTGELMRAVIEMDDKKFVVYSVQLTSPLNDPSNFDDRTRSEDADRVRRTAEGEQNPLIILGDFNMSDATEEYKLFTAEFIDVFRHTSTGFGSTFPNLRGSNPSLSFIPPVIRLDYAFVSADVQPVASQVIYDGVSDHLPLLITVRVP